MASVDIERVCQLVEAVAAAEVMPRFSRLAPGDVRSKPGGEVVTVADEAVEAWLGPRLRELLPGSIVVGEEAAATNPDLIARLSEDCFAWVIDPIDGTANFAEGRAAFVVMVALVRGRETRAGWIHDPVNGRTASASLGEGAWIGSRRLTVAPPTSDIAAMTGTLHAGQFGSKEVGRRIERRRGCVRAVRSLRSAGLEYLRLATGENHFSLFTKLMPWDHAAGVIIHREAGGFSAYFDGDAYEPHRIDQSGLLLAPDRASWRSLHALLLAD
jgi:fructose-1,6-bisphosphatase/inositol monophosphatase family enzyme